AGIYWAVVHDHACNDSAISNFVTVCQPHVILQNACICKRPPDIPLNLEVDITGCDGCPGCTFNYTWTEAPGTFSGTGTGLLVCGVNTITIPSAKLPPALPAGSVLHFTIHITS